METKTKSRFIYWFAYYNLESPSVRYRGKYALEYLKSNYGVNSFFVIPGYKLRSILYFLHAYFSALFHFKKDSIIVIQRIHSSFIYSTLLKLLIKFRKSESYYDLDDADYLDYPAETIYHFLKNCSGVFVGSRELAKNLSSFNRNIILNTSPVPKPYFIKEKKNSELTIGWIGDFTGGHKEALLKYFFSALHKLNFNIRFVILGVGRKSKSHFQFLSEYFSPLQNIKLELPENIDWNDERALQKRIAEFDVGIATLLNNELHLSKSAFKLKQYLNCGVPVLSSDLPENNFFLHHGVNGFLCSTPEQFRERIIEFHEMPREDYMAFSKQARQSSIDFNLDIYCKTLLTGKGQPLHEKSKSQTERIIHFEEA